MKTETAIDKQMAISEMSDPSVTRDPLVAYAQANRIRAAILVSLMELREAIDEGFAKLDQTHVEAAMMFVGAKESFDEYILRRMTSDRVLVKLLASVSAIREQGPQEPDTAPVGDQQTSPEPTPTEKKDQAEVPTVTLNKGNFGGPISESGISSAIAE